MQGSQAYNLREEREEGEPCQNLCPRGGAGAAAEAWSGRGDRGPSFPAVREEDIPTPFQALGWEPGTKSRSQALPWDRPHNSVQGLTSRPTAPQPLTFKINILWVFFFFSSLLLRHAGVPRPGIKPTPTIAGTGATAVTTLDS